METSKLRLLILPSLVSGLGTVFLSLAFITGAIFSYTAGKGMIYDYLFGPNSSAELIRSARGSIDAFKDTVFGNPFLNKILFFLFWMLVGLVVYIILYFVFRGTSAAAEDIQETTYMNRRADEVLKNLETRIATRVFFAVFWGLYWVFFIKTLLPFGMLSARIGASDFPALPGWLYGLLGLLVLVLSVHLHIVFLRLVAMRLRIFGSQEIEKHDKA